MKSEIDNFIGVFDFDIPDYCNDIVKFFDRVHNTNKTMNKIQHPFWKLYTGNLTRS